MRSCICYSPLTHESILLLGWGYEYGSIFRLDLAIMKSITDVFLIPDSLNITRLSVHITLKTFSE
jgi:hypothetical protein